MRLSSCRLARAAEDAEARANAAPGQEAEVDLDMMLEPLQVGQAGDGVVPCVRRPNMSFCIRCVRAGWK